MKIIKNPKDMVNLRLLREIANNGCDVCPCCGERKTSMQYIKEGILNKGIANQMVCRFSNWRFRNWRFRNLRTDLYECKTCGAEWESEPYEYIY